MPLQKPNIKAINPLTLSHWGAYMFKFLSLVLLLPLFTFAKDYKLCSTFGKLEASFSEDATGYLKILNTIEQVKVLAHSELLKQDAKAYSHLISNKTPVLVDIYELENTSGELIKIMFIIDNTGHIYLFDTKTNILEAQSGNC